MKNTKQSTLILICLLLTGSAIFAQTKRLKRPSSRIGVYSADTFVRESFDIYDKTYRYDGYAEAGKPLTDNDVYILKSALTDAERILATAPNVVSDLDGVGAFKQTKATLQINRAKKALRYCIETIPELLKGRKTDGDQDGDQDDTSEGDDSDSSDSDDSGGGGNSGNTEGQNDTNNDNSSGPIVINTKFDFVPGNELIFFDDFAADYVGDFPSKWNTNGSGEVVTFGDNPQKWFELKNGANTFYVPDLAGLPEEYTIEFDVTTVGVSRETSSAARLRFLLETNSDLRLSAPYLTTSINYPQYTTTQARITTNIPGHENINNSLDLDLRELQKTVHHYAIAVNKQRFRLWVNQVKCIDVPRVLPPVAIMQNIKLNMSGFKDGTERLFVTNVKIAKGGLDLRGELISQGSVSTNGILFDSGSSSIQSQSYGIIRQISQVLKQDTSMKLRIVGYTDSDGEDATNITLSQARAAAVKQALISIYGIDAGRLTTDGKGEADPVAGNDSPEGKAQNRRVVFTKQ